MKAPKFEKSKISRLIKAQGLSYTFNRDELNEFKEPTGAVSAMTVHGVFHQQAQHITVISADAASVQQKQSPFVLALYDEARNIHQGDYVFINGVRYNVNGLTDIGNWNIAIDISLEAVV